jgi:hypothetical protein
MEGEMHDRRKDRLKHTLQGIAIGAALAVVVGFSWLGWTLDSTARKVAEDQANSAVVAALSPICVARFMRQPDAPGKLVKFRETDSWKQRELVENGGWATMAGSTSPNPSVASACAEELAKAGSS